MAEQQREVSDFGAFNRSQDSSLFAKLMDRELRCHSCKEYYQLPIHLPCSHSICFVCAFMSVRTTSRAQNSDSAPDGSFPSDLDQLSVTSDNDSGISSISRPSSLLLPPALPEISCLSASSTDGRAASTYLRCPECSIIIYMGVSDVKSLPKNQLLTSMIQRYQKETSSPRRTFKCRSCSQSEATSITFICEQCQIGYCGRCREQYHPMRGPLSKHSFIDIRELSSSRPDGKSFCHDHADCSINFYCLHCQSGCCQLCSSHEKHQVVSIQQATKILKTQLSSQLQDLSETAQRSADFLTQLKLYPEYLKRNAEAFQTTMVQEIDNLVSTLEDKKRELKKYLHAELEKKLSSIHQQCSTYNEHIQRTTGFLQFSIEALKHSDPYIFLQAHRGLNKKCSSLQESFSSEYECKSQSSAEIDFSFSADGLYRDIRRLEFQQIKPPSSPRFISEQCVCHDNECGTTSGTLSWSTCSRGGVQGFILELDNGTVGSEFRQVYAGNETMCAIDGLLPSRVYTARIKAYNQAGESADGDCITLHSSSADWFTFNPRTTHPDIQFLSNEYHSITCRSVQDRVALGSRGFREGIHYWTVVVQRYEDKSDPAFGIARFDASRGHMLGKDSKSWCMYIDNQRSWFMHNGQHMNRIQKGITVGAGIGILLDLDNGTLRFYVNDQTHGPIAFSNLTRGDIYFPAVSLNKHVQVALISGVNAP